MGNFCAGKQAKKEAKLEEKDKPGEKQEETVPLVDASVGIDGVNVEVKDAGATDTVANAVEEGKGKAPDGMRIVKDRAKEIAKEAEAKALARKHAAEEAARKTEEEAKVATSSTAVAAADIAASAQEAADETKNLVESEAQKKKDEAVAAASALAEAAKETVQETQESVVQEAEKVKEEVVAEVEAAKQSAEDAVDSTALSAESAATAAQSAIAESVTSAEESAKAASDTVQTQITEAVQSTQAVAESAASEVKEEVSKTVVAVQEQVASAADDVQVHASEQVQAAQDSVSSARETVDSAAGEAASKVEEASTEAVDTAQGMTESVSDQVKETEQVASQLASAVQEAAQATADDVSNAADAEVREVQEVASAVEAAAAEEAQTAQTLVTDTAEEVNSKTGAALQETINKAEESLDSANAEASKAAQQVSDISQAADEVASSAEAVAASMEADVAEPSLETDAQDVDIGQEEDSKPAVSESLLEAGSALVQQAIQAGMQSVAEKVQEAIGTKVEGDSVPQGDEAAASQEDSSVGQYVEDVVEKNSSAASEGLQSAPGLFVPSSENNRLSAHVTAVERGEETMLPFMRETCVRKCSLQGGEVTPDENSLPPFSDEGFLPPPPEDFSANEEEFLPDAIPPPATPDEEMLQRVAAEVTNQAVQEAIRLVTENGLGSSPSDDNDNSQVDLPSPLSSSAASPSDEASSNQAVAGSEDNLIDVIDDLSALPPPIAQSPPADIVPSPLSPLSPLEPLSGVDPKSTADKITIQEAPAAPLVANGNEEVSEVDSQKQTEALIWKMMSTTDQWKKERKDVWPFCTYVKLLPLPHTLTLSPVLYCTILIPVLSKMLVFWKQQIWTILLPTIQKKKKSKYF